MRLVRMNSKLVVAWRLGKKTTLYATALPSFLFLATANIHLVPLDHQTNIDEPSTGHRVGQMYIPLVSAEMLLIDYRIYYRVLQLCHY